MINRVIWKIKDFVLGRLILKAWIGRKEVSPYESALKLETCDLIGVVDGRVPLVWCGPGEGR